MLYILLLLHGKINNKMITVILKYGVPCTYDRTAEDVNGKKLRFLTINRQFVISTAFAARRVHDCVVLLTFSNHVLPLQFTKIKFYDTKRTSHVQNITMVGI